MQIELEDFNKITEFIKEHDGEFTKEEMWKEFSKEDKSEMGDKKWKEAWSRTGGWISLHHAGALSVSELEMSFIDSWQVRILSPALGRWPEMALK